jgi:ribosomal protein L37AE/L43A
MPGQTRSIEPFGFFSAESLRAGWYLAWRLTVVVLPLLLVPIVVAGVVGAWGLWLAAALLALGGIVAAVVVAVQVTNRVAGAWALTEYGRPLARGVWWSVTWRVCLVGVPLSLLLAPLSLVSQGPLFIGGVLDLVLPFVGLLLGALYVVATLQSYGWAMSTAVADRLGVAGALEMDDLDEPMPARPPAASRRPVNGSPAVVPPVSTPERRASAPARQGAAPAGAAATPARAAAARARVAAPARAAAVRPAAARPPAPMQCPRCGLQETERGSIIGWYCRVCGWREKRG